MVTSPCWVTFAYFNELVMLPPHLNAWFVTLFCQHQATQFVSRPEDFLHRAFLRLSSCQSGISRQRGQTFILLLFSFSPQIFFPQVVYLSTPFPFLPAVFTALLRKSFGGAELKLTTLCIIAINFHQKGCFYVSFFWQPSHICVPLNSRIRLTWGMSLSLLTL